jgi:hypothetical protein
MNTMNDPASGWLTRARRQRAIGVNVLTLLLTVFALALPAAAGARSETQMMTKRVPSVAIVTMRDFRVAGLSTGSLRTLEEDF